MAFFLVVCSSCNSFYGVVGQLSTAFGVKKSSICNFAKISSPPSHQELNGCELTSAVISISSFIIRKCSAFRPPLGQSQSRNQCPSLRFISLSVQVWPKGHKKLPGVPVPGQLWFLEWGAPEIWRSPWSIFSGAQQRFRCS